MIFYSQEIVVEALEKEAVKWTNISQGHTFENECPLCDLFLFLNDCSLCPISAKTGMTLCKGSPADDYNEHYKIHGIDSNGVISKCSTCKKYAKRQADFIHHIIDDEGE